VQGRFWKKRAGWVAVVVLAVALPLAAGPVATGAPPVAAAAKKCHKKHAGAKKKRKCKRKHSATPPASTPSNAPYTRGYLDWEEWTADLDLQIFLPNGQVDCGECNPHIAPFSWETGPFGVTSYGKEAVATLGVNTTPLTFRVCDAEAGGNTTFNLSGHYSNGQTFSIDQTIPFGTTGPVLTVRDPAGSFDPTGMPCVTGKG
jgi:hypothetical protein